MKRLISLVLILALGINSLFAQSSSNYSATNRRPQDVNGDGKVDTQDVLAIYDYMVSGGDEDSDGGNGLYETVKNDTNKLFVTGGISNTTLGYAEDLSWTYSEYSGEKLSGFYPDRFYVTLYGYANLPTEMKVLLGNSVYFGIEVADNADFNNARRIYAESLDADNKFTVTTWAKTGSTLYWRAVMLTGSVIQYEVSRSQLMPSLEESIKELPLELEEPFSIGKTYFYVSIKQAMTDWLSSRSVGLVYSTDPDKLTADSLRLLLSDAKWETVASDESGWIKNQYGYLLMQTDGVNFLRPYWRNYLKQYNVVGLQPGTKYYYCLYVKANGYVSTGDIQEVTTDGLSLDDVKRYVSVSITPDDVNYQWRVNFSSTLEENYPQEEFTYEIITGPLTEKDYIGIYCKSTKISTGPSYSGVIPFCMVYGQVYYDSGNYQLSGLEVANNLLERIVDGKADDSDKAEFAKLVSMLGPVYDAPTAVQIRVKTGGITYPVATKYE